MMDIISTLESSIRVGMNYFGEILYICDRNGERSLAIQNNVPQSTPLISKSLPVRITPNGNLLLLSQIARNLKNDSENLFSW